MSDIVQKLLAEANLHGGELAELLEGAASEIDLLRDEKGDLRTRAESAERERDEAYAKGQRDRDEEIIQVTKGLTNEVAALAMRVAIRSLPIKERPQ